MVSASTLACTLVAAATIERLPASSALRLRHPALLVAIAALVAAASAPAASETLVALTPVRVEVARRNRAWERGRLAQAEQALQPPNETEGLFDGSFKGLGRT
jgi:hypothetical protein